MIKITTLLLFLASITTTAQKKDTEVKKFTIPVPKSEYFSAIKNITSLFRA